MAQRLIRTDLLDRVNATFRLVGLGTMPIGALLGGFAGDLTGLAPVLIGSALACLIAAAVAVTGLDGRMIGNLR